MTRTAEDLLQELLAVDESHRIEAKRASQIDRSVMETVVAFSNEPGLGGGHLLLGVERDPEDLFGTSYRVTGVADPDKLQSELASQCASMLNRPVRPEELAWNDEELLRALSAAVRQGGELRPTVAGLLLFGTGPALRRCFPMMRIDYIRVPGRQWLEDPEHRFDTLEIRAPLLAAIRRAEGRARRADAVLLAA
jgi:predicted HTH transcriptional regulator